MPHAEPSIQLAVGDVSIFALVQIEHPIYRECLQVANEVGRHHRDEMSLCHDPSLDIIELKPGVGSTHVAYDTNVGFRMQIPFSVSVSIPLLFSLYCTFHSNIVYRELQILPTPHHLDCVPFIVIQLLTCQENLWSFAWENVKGLSDNHSLPS